MRQERLRKSDHLNPLADIPELARVAADAGFRIGQIRYYTPIVGGFVENILMRLGGASDWRDVPPARLRCRRSRPTRGRQRWRRAPTAKRRVAESGVTCAALRALTLAMKLDLLLFGRIESGPFFALLRATSP